MARDLTPLPTRLPPPPPPVVDQRRKAAGPDRAFPDLLAGAPAAVPGAPPPDPAAQILANRLPPAARTALQVPALPPPPPQLVNDLAAQHGRAVITALDRANRLAALTPPAPAFTAAAPVPGPLTNGIFVPLTDTATPAPLAVAAATPAAAVPAAPTATRLADLADAIAQVAARQQLTAAVAARTPEPGAAPDQAATPATPAFRPPTRTLIDQRV